MDVSAEADYLQLLKKLNKNGTSVVLVSHHLYDIVAVAKQIVIVNNGTTTLSDTESLMKNRVLETIYDRPFISGTIGSYPVIVPGNRG